MTMQMQILEAWTACRPSVANILGRVSYETGLARNVIHSRDRHAPVARARAAVVWLAQRLTRLSSSQLGRQLDRDHSTILSAAAKAAILRDKDPAFRRMTDRILDHFRDIQED